MKLLALSILTATAANSLAGMNGDGFRNLIKRGGGGSSASPGCSFTLSSSGSFACPAGQLDDGQIRLNGSEETVPFFLQPGGGFIDQKGFGCIVTGSPATQIQCDQGAAPDPSFTIDSANNLLYKGSPNFYACPATDTEYNIYVNPDFGQTKCFAISLQTSGCGAAASSCPAVAPITVWETVTQTVTQLTSTAVTVTTTGICSSAPVSSSAWSNSTTPCPHCTKISSAGI